MSHGLFFASCARKVSYWSRVLPLAQCIGPGFCHSLNYMFALVCWGFFQSATFCLPGLDRSMLSRAKSRANACRPEPTFAGWGQPLSSGRPVCSRNVLVTYPDPKAKAAKRFTQYVPPRKLLLMLQKIFKLVGNTICSGSDALRFGAADEGSLSPLEFDSSLSMGHGGAVARVLFESSSTEVPLAVLFRFGPSIV